MVDWMDRGAVLVAAAVYMVQEGRAPAGDRAQRAGAGARKAMVVRWAAEGGYRPVGRQAVQGSTGMVGQA